MKIMKTLNFLLPIIIIIIISTSCEEIKVGNEFLSQPPELDYTLDSVFAKSSRAKEVLWNAYSTLPYGLGELPPDPTKPFPYWDLTDIVMDNVSWGNTQHWRDGNVTPMDVDDFGNRFGPAKYDWALALGFEGIRDAYIFIDNVDRVPDMDEDERIRLKAEAKMIIATNYVEMFRNYGGILYVNHAYKPTEDTKLERLTIMQTVDTLTKMIDDSKDKLPVEIENPEVWSGRFTQAGALAVKVKLLTFAASPLFNSDEPFMPQSHQAIAEKLVWTGGYNRDLWVRTRDAAKELIDMIEGSSYYGLVNTGNPREDFTKAYFERGTGEALLSVRRYDKVEAPWHTDKVHIWGQEYFAGDKNGPKVLPQHNWVKKFPMKNGMSIDDPASGYDSSNPYANRDPRLYESVVTNGDNWLQRKAELWIGGRERKVKRGNHRDLTGYILRKWILDYRETLDRYTHWPYVRIPEVYLSYAEALNELNNGPTDEAFEYANKVRARVQVGPIENFIGKPRNQITKQEFLDAIINERAIELGCEGIRWFDMVRYKMEDVFKSPILAVDVTLKDTANTINNFSNFFQNEVELDEHSIFFNYEITELEIGTFRWATDFSPKYYLEPMPFKEIQKDYGLIQNPGWEFQ